MSASARGYVRPEAWMDDAACLHVDPDMFFPDADRYTTQIARAKAVCASCPVREACLEYALRTGFEHGVWGGMTTHERTSDDSAACAHALSHSPRRHVPTATTASGPCDGQGCVCVTSPHGSA